MQGGALYRDALIRPFEESGVQSFVGRVCQSRYVSSY